jgi:alkylation response protein AidB-like acyl-CoA dehydrogenase
MSLLTIHLYVAFVVAALAVVAVWRQPERRVTLYVVTLQIIIGIVLVVQHFRAPAAHYALGVLGWAGYMVANGLARRSDRAGLVRIVAGVSSILILVGYYLGMHAVKTGYHP